MGRVYLIGAGPGAADLITVRGARLLAQADVVLHDALVEPELLALCPQAKRIAVGKRCGKLSTSQRFINKRLVDAAYQHTTVVRLKGGDPMLLVEPELLALCPQAKRIAVGKRCGRLSTSQRFINKRLVDAAYQHTTVVRLKGGDPMLFGRADEELAALEDAGIAYEIIPGITAAQAGAACLGRSLTLRGVARSIAFVTHAKAQDDVSQESSLAQPNADTLVYYMARVTSRPSQLA